MLEYEMDLIVYDEIEYFREWDSPLFDYPYTPRKNEIQSYKFKIPFNPDTSGYSFYSQELKFQKSVTCLEPSYLDQMNFIGEL